MTTEGLSVAEKMRRVVEWLNYMDESFNEHFKDANSAVYVWEHSYTDMVDNLWDDLEPDEDGWVDEDIIHDAILVNKAFGEEYYPIPKKYRK